MTCKICGKEFIPTGRRQLYCGSRKIKTGCSFDILVKKRKQYRKENLDKCRQSKNNSYKKNREYYVEYQKILSDKCKLIVNSYKSEKGCVRCGINDARVLDCHHTRDKKHLISTLVGSGRLKELRKEIEKCDVLCANCHRIEHSIEENIL